MRSRNTYRPMFPVLGGSLTAAMLIAATTPDLFTKEAALYPAEDLLTRPDPLPNCIFVFGSNTAGIHGKGAALTAREAYGAKGGVGVGLTGRAYAIPTKDDNLRGLSPFKIAGYVGRFIGYAEASEQYQNDDWFIVTRIGTGLRGLPDDVIAPMFADAPVNCILPAAWKEVLLPIMPPALFVRRQWHEREGKE